MQQRKGKRVVILDRGYTSYDCEREILAEAGCTVDIFEGERHDRDGRIAFSQGAAGLLVRWTEIDGPFLDAVPGVEAVVRYGVGYDNIDLAAATARGVRVANVQGYARHSVSDHALALILACARALPLGEALFSETYGHAPRPDLVELRLATLGIVGLGQIGSALARKAQPLFRRIVASDPYIPDAQFEAMGAEKTALPALLESSDVVTLHCNLTDETTHLIDRAAFAHMKRRPILINTARGAVVDEAALLEALEQDRIHSAGIDVYSTEPPPVRLRPLLNHPRVISTGHYAFYSESAMIELQRRAARNLSDLLSGAVPEDCLNP